MTHSNVELPLRDELSQRALRYVLDGRVYVDGFREFVVMNSDRSSGKHVIYVTGDPKCQCKTSREHKQICIHIRAVEIAIKLGQQRELSEPKRRPPAESFRTTTDVECPWCGARDYRKDGPRRTKQGANQRYECKSCDRKFSNDLGFARHRYAMDIIEEALDLRMEGLSLGKVQRHLQKRYGLKPSLSSQYRWQRKFGERLATYDEQNAPPLRDSWQADEVAVFVRGKQYWSWHVIHPRYRYWLANTLSRNKTSEDAARVLLAAKKVAKGAPRLVVTDGHTSYPQAVRKHLWRQKEPTTHVSCPPIRSIKAKHGESKDKGVHLAQQRVERLNGTMRVATDLLRGVKNRAAGEAFVRVFRAYYNLIRPHEALDGQTPAEAIGMRLPQFDGGTRMLAILIEQFKRERAERRMRLGLPAAGDSPRSKGAVEPAS